MCQKKSKMDTTIGFVKISKKQHFLEHYSKKIIWNRDIIMLVVRLIEFDEKFKTKHVLLKFKVFEKIKQVSSTKLTNWYKTLVGERIKRNELFHRLIFLGANRKVSKILLLSLRASFSKIEKLFCLKKKSTQVQNTGT